jgi:hypothetical protein
VESIQLTRGDDSVVVSVQVPRVAAETEGTAAGEEEAEGAAAEAPAPEAAAEEEK